MPSREKGTGVRKPTRWRPALAEQPGFAPASIGLEHLGRQRASGFLTSAWPGPDLARKETGIAAPGDACPFGSYCDPAAALTGEYSAAAPDYDRK